MPSLNTVNPSPPVARKLFIVTRNVSVGLIMSTSTPFTQIVPILAAQVAPAGFCSYFSVDEICSVLAEICPPQPANCCSSTRRI